MAQIITIASGKGGTGKSTVAAGIAKALSELGQKVVLIDGSIGLRSLDIITGADDNVLCTYMDVYNGNCTLDEALIDCGGYALLSPPQNEDTDNVSRDFLINFCKDLQNSFDFIIIDSGSGIYELFSMAIAPADKVILITESDDVSIRCIDRTAGVAEQHGKTDLLLVINKVNPEYIKKGIQCAPGRTIDMLGISTVGIVPDCNYKSRRCNPATAYSNIARRLMGEKVPLMEL